MIKRKPISIDAFIKKDFTPETMGTGYKRGFVLVIYKAKIAEVAGKKVAALVEHAKMKGTYDNPDLYIYCRSDAVRYTLNMQRINIKQKINERMKSEFINKVMVK